MAINVTRSSMPDFEEYCKEIEELWETRWLTNSGTKHKQLEKQLEDFLGVNNVTLYVNGHLALENIIQAMSFPVGSEVITTPFTFISTTNAISRNGHVPVFCDVNFEDYTIDPDKIEALITDKTVAILPVHVYGNVCDTEKIESIAKKHGLKVIYDAAHAFGEVYKGKSVASYGDASMFSFHATKVYNTIEGGALCYSDDTLSPILDKLKNFGLDGEDCTYIGGNAKMNEFQAAMGICNLRHIREEIEKRKAAVTRYTEILSGINGIKLCPVNPLVESNYAYFPVVFDSYKYSRDEVFERLKAQNIMARKYFYPLTNQVEAYKKLQASNTTPIAEHIATRVLTLPLYADLSLKDVEYICDIILK